MELIGPVLDCPDAVAGSSYLRPKLNQWTYIWSILADDIWSICFEMFDKSWDVERWPTKRCDPVQLSGTNFHPIWMFRDLPLIRNGPQWPPHWTEGQTDFYFVAKRGTFFEPFEIGSARMAASRRAWRPLSATYSQPITDDWTKRYFSINNRLRDTCTHLSGGASLHIQANVIPGSRHGRIFHQQFLLFFSFKLFHSLEIFCSSFVVYVTRLLLLCHFLSRRQLEHIRSTSVRHFRRFISFS